MPALPQSRKALVVRPLKASAPMGATLAILGLNRAIPILHGSQGCSAFTKVYFTQHYREPIPMQTSAMDQVSAVMNADANLKEGMATVLSKTGADVVGVITTGLTETQGVDLGRVLKEFRRESPAWSHVPLVAVNTHDALGNLEIGFARAVRAMVTALVPAVRPTRRLLPSRRINVLTGAALTPGDAEALHELAAAFDLEACLLPDLSGGMDGHLDPGGFTPLTTGGSRVEDWAEAASALATVVVGTSLHEAADLLKERTGVEDLRFASLTSLLEWDTLVMALGRLSGREIPRALRRQREQYLDALLDTHFLLSGARVAVAGDGDMVRRWLDLLAEVGAEAATVVTTASSPALESFSGVPMLIGDLEDFARLAREHGAEALVGNDHVADLGHELNLAVVRDGFPNHHAVGAYRRVRIGYRGMRDALCDLANAVHEGRPQGATPYLSSLAATAFPV